MHKCKCGKKIDYRSKHCYSCEMKRRYKDPIHRDKMIRLARKSMLIFPNKPEKLLIKLLPKSFKYVGNGSLIVGGFNPDFVDKKNKLIIEVFGDYWHNLISYKKRDKIKLKIYKQCGYKTLIVWEHELKNLNKVINKIRRFNVTI